MKLTPGVINSAWLITERVFVMALTFLNALLLARLGGPELFGQYNVITAFAALLAPLYLLGLNNIATRYFIRYPANSHYYLSAALRLRFTGAGLAVVIGGALAYFLYADAGLITLLLVQQSFTAFYIVEFYFLAREKVTATLKVRVASLVVTNLLKLWVILTDPKLELLVLLQGLEFVIIGLGYWWLYNSDKGPCRQKRPVSWATCGALFSRARWVLLAGIAAGIYLKIDQLMLSLFQGNEAVAYYAAAAKLSEFWFVFPVIVANAFNPSLFRSKKLGEKRYHNDLLSMLALFFAVALIIALTVYWCAPWLVVALFGEAYQSSAAILAVHIFTGLFVFQRAVFSKWLIIEKLYSYSLMTHGLGAISNVVLNLWLIPLYGGLGAAWATLFSYAVASYLALFIKSETRSFAILMTKAMCQFPLKIKGAGRLLMDVK